MTLHATQYRKAADTGLDLAAVVAGLADVRQHWRLSQQRTAELVARELPSRGTMVQIVKNLRGVLFPMRLGPPDLLHEGEDFYVGHTLGLTLQSLLEQVRLELGHHARLTAQPDDSDQELRAAELVRQFAHGLPEIRRLLDSDVTAAFHADPAARSVDEVLLCYPGIQAVIAHRIAHRLYALGAPLLARMISEAAHGATGIDIHPGASIGPGFFIDHGTGVVIGETASIGRNVRLFQNVTLGAKSFPTDASGQVIKGQPRHPIVEDEVVIYAGATVLGRITIGQGAVIGGNVWVTEAVAPYAHVTQARSHHDIKSAPMVQP